MAAQGMGRFAARQAVRVGIVQPREGFRTGAGVAKVTAMTATLRGAALALLLSLPVAARGKSSTFQVGAVVAPSLRVSAGPGLSPRSLRLSVASNAPSPVVQVGSGALLPLGSSELRLPASGSVVVTLLY
jgi:hypothetical protein